MTDTAARRSDLLADPRRRLGGAIRRQLFSDAGVDYRHPAGDPGLFGPGSITWQVHANPVSLAIGGIAAVILELAEPRVRTGVWEHSSFRSDPLGRMRRTAQAAMVTTYGPTELVERRIAMVNRMHGRVSGWTPEGQAYHGRDPELLTWVQVTASYGFLNAYVRYVDPQLSGRDRDRYYAEAAAAGSRFGAGALPADAAGVDRLLESMGPKLKPHPILGEFLQLVSTVSPVGPAGRPLQPLMVEAAIDLLPPWVVRQLQLQGSPLRTGAARLTMSGLARAARRLPNEIVDQARERMADGPPRA